MIRGKETLDPAEDPERTERARELARNGSGRRRELIGAKRVADANSTMARRGARDINICLAEAAEGAGGASGK
jgi:hypothetical protein